MSGSTTDFQAWQPDWSTMALPQAQTDDMIATRGIRLGWLKSYSCPCVAGNGVIGAPDPNCLTCNGRGTYWSDTAQNFTGLITFMHTSSAPDEPGAQVDVVQGAIERAEPTLSIPATGSGAEATVWAQASRFDAYVEYDAIYRANSILIVGGNQNLPYWQNLDITSVTVWNPTTLSVVNVPLDECTITGGSVVPNGYPPGTAYTVEYTTVPVYVAERSAGGMPHARPFGLNATKIPRRFRIVTLDLWTRARFAGDGPQGISSVGPT